MEKITTRRRESVGIIVEKNEESRRTFNKNLCDLHSNNAYRNSVSIIQNKQFNKKTSQFGIKPGFSRSDLVQSLRTWSQSNIK